MKLWNGVRVCAPALVALLVGCGGGGTTIAGIHFGPRATAAPSLSPTSGPAVARLAISVNGTLAVGQPGVLTIAVNAFDATGNLIAGSTAYAAPIALTSSGGGSGAVLSTKTVSAPTQTISLAYDGTPQASPFVITAAMAGISSASISWTPLADRTYDAGVSTTFKITATSGAAAPTQTNAVVTYSASAGVGEAGTTGTVHTVITGTDPATQSLTIQDDVLAYIPQADGAVGVALLNTNRASNTTSASRASVGNTQLTYMPGLLLDIVPHAARTWPSAVTTRSTSRNTTTPVGKSPLTSTSALTAIGDGSYNATFGFVSGASSSTSTVVVNSDGSNVQTFAFAGSSTTTMTTGLPNANGIPQTTTVVGGPAPVPTPVATTLPNFYPGGVSPRPLATRTTVQRGPTALPAECAGATPSSAADLVETTTTSFDPTGFASNEVDSEYDVGGVGIVCLRVLSTSTQYDVTTGKAFAPLIFAASTVRTGATRKTTSLSSPALAGIAAGLRSAMDDVRDHSLRRATRI